MTSPKHPRLLDNRVAAARADMAAAYRIAARWGMNEGVDNHFTARVPGAEDLFFINPQIHWSEIRASDVLVVDADGKIIDGNRKPPGSGPNIHIPIHQAHTRGGAVFHTHMPWATALAMIADGRLAMCHQNATRFFDDVAYDDDFNGLAMDPGEGRRMAAIQGNKSILFLANHGVVSVAETIAEALDNLYYLERACQAQVLAMSTGRPLRLIPEAVARRSHVEFQSVLRKNALLHFDSMKRILARAEPEYAD